MLMIPRIQSQVSVIILLCDLTFLMFIITPPLKLDTWSMHSTTLADHSTSLRFRAQELSLKQKLSSLLLYEQDFFSLLKRDRYNT